MQFHWCEVWTLIRALGTIQTSNLHPAQGITCRIPISFLSNAEENVLSYSPQMNNASLLKFFL